MKKVTHKLNLRKETITSLQPIELSKVAGGLQTKMPCTVACPTFEASCNDSMVPSCRTQ